MMYEVLVLFGSNVEPEKHFQAALRQLESSADVRVFALSNKYVSPAVIAPGNVDTTRPPYLNAAIRLRTSLARARLQELLRDIEENLGRIRTADKYADRTVDLDILGYRVEGTMEATDSTLVERSFALIPAAEVAPEWVHPATGMTLAELAEGLRPIGLTQI